MLALQAAMYAQVPGYMGKRFVVGYGFYFSPAVAGSNGQGNSILGNIVNGSGNSETGTLAFNSLHEGFVEYAVTKKLMLGLSARLYKSTYDNGSSFDINDYNYGQYYSSSETHPEGLYHIKGRNYCFYVKSYFGKYLAPWGRYFMFGPSLNTYTCHYDPSEMKVRVNEYNTTNGTQYFSNFGPQDQRFVKFDFNAGFGRSRIVANRIMIDYGFNVQLGALATSLFDAVGEPLFSTFDRSAVNYISRTSPVRVRGVNRFNAFLKIGVLLF